MRLDSIACIFSVSGLTLTNDEKRLFATAQPFGFILFKRNCETRAQVTTLTKELRETVGWDCPILIDQEGGRVQRLKPPEWGQYKPMQYYGDSGDTEALQRDTALIARDLTEIGITVNCAPCLDVLTPETHDVIGDRAFSDDPDKVAIFGQIVCDAYLDNGVTPIVKHLPGHGRATADSHLELPVVDADLNTLKQTDFVPFMNITDPRVWGMTAHVIYTAIDENHPVSVSEKGIQIIRNDIGFNGVLLSDDLGMKALDHYGSVNEKCENVLHAGCDLALHCNGQIDDMHAIAESCPKLRDDTIERLEQSDVFLTTDEHG